MKTAMTALGWTLRASAAICIVWIAVQVGTGGISTLQAILSSVVWHACFALSGVALVGAGKKVART
jgi:hypothetical protein